MADFTSLYSQTLNHPLLQNSNFDTINNFSSYNHGHDFMAMNFNDNNILSFPHPNATNFRDGNDTQNIKYATEAATDFGASENSLGGRKRKRKDERKMEKLKEVVHVRAKRGQATDSHSLAERVRREKINIRLKNLQDLVPGCYKKMGMAVMLDVIIKYVQSLQHQIEFLSMKLSAATMQSNFELTDMDGMEKIRDTSSLGIQGIGRMETEEYGLAWPYL